MSWWRNDVSVIFGPTLAQVSDSTKPLLEPVMIYLIISNTVHQSIPCGNTIISHEMNFRYSWNHIFSMRFDSWKYQENNQVLWLLMTWWSSAPTILNLCTVPNVLFLINTDLGTHIDLKKKIQSTQGQWPFYYLSHNPHSHYLLQSTVIQPYLHHITLLYGRFHIKNVLFSWMHPITCSPGVHDYMWYI